MRPPGTLTISAAWQQPSETEATRLTPVAGGCAAPTSLFPSCRVNTLCRSIVSRRHRNCGSRHRFWLYVLYQAVSDVHLGLPFRCPCRVGVRRRPATHHRLATTRKRKATGRSIR